MKGLKKGQSKGLEKVSGVTSNFVPPEVQVIHFYPRLGIYPTLCNNLFTKEQK